jgi:hypothetical protein
MIKLTRTVINGARPEARDDEIRDTVTPGFLPKVTPTDRRGFMLACTAANGQRRKPAIGHYGEMPAEQARGIALDWPADIRRGTDPSATGLPTLADRPRLPPRRRPHCRWGMQILPRARAEPAPASCAARIGAGLQVVASLASSNASPITAGAPRPCAASRHARPRPPMPIGAENSGRGRWQSPATGAALGETAMDTGCLALAYLRIFLYMR